MWSHLVILFLSITSIVDANVQCPTFQFRPEVIKNPAATWTIQWSQLTPAITGGQVQLVDIHITRNSQQYNYRMNLSPFASIDHDVRYYTFQDQPLAIGETISYSFTYIVSWPERNTIFACDTEDFQFTVPGATQVPTTVPTCPTLTFTSRIEKNPGATWTVQWFQSSPSSTAGEVNSVDIHVTRDSGMANHVMIRSPYSWFPDHSVFFYTWPTPQTQLQPGESLTYSFTYHVQTSTGGEISCTTDTYQFTVPGAPATSQPQSCPVVTITSHVEHSAGQYTFIADAGINPDPIDWIDIHIMTTSGFYNYRTQLSSTSTSSHPIYELTLPVPLGLGETVEYYYTIKTDTIACDTETLSYTTSADNPTQGTTPATGEICPVISFTHAITSQDGIYTVTLTPTTTRPIEWIDIHIKTDTDAEFHARMDMGYTKLLPSYITSASSAIYYFTSLSQTTVCNSNTFIKFF